MIRQNSFGLGLNFIETRKRSMQPLMGSDAGSLLSPQGANMSQLPGLASQSFVEQ